MVQNEKRKVPRRKVHIPIICWEEATGRRAGKGVEIVSRDVSGDGLAFYAPHIYPIGSNLFVDIFLPNHKKPISCAVKIVRVVSKRRNGSSR